MPKYAIVIGNVVDGIAIAEQPLDVAGVWVCVDDLDPQPGPRWTYESGVFTRPVFVEPPPVKIISKVAFRFRFTDAEYAGIITAAKTDAEVQAWYDTFNMVATIDLDNQRTKNGVATLVSKNLLTQARADEILTAPAQENELA